MLGTGRLQTMEVLRPAQRKTYRVEVYEAPTQRDRDRGERPAPMGTFTVDGLTLGEAESQVRSRLAEDYTGRRIRAFSHNARTAGFVVYYQAGA